MKVYVSLTSISERIDTVHETVKSVLAQTAPIHKLYIFLSSTPFLLDKGISQKRLQETSLYKLYLENDKIQIVFVPNTGPYRKLIPFLSMGILESEDVVITIDDDQVYKPACIQQLLTSAALHKNAIISNMGCKLNVSIPYSQYFNNNVCIPPLLDFKNLAIGYAGVLYRPHFFVKENYNLSTLSESELKTDDLYYKLVTHRRHVPVYINNYYSLTNETYSKGLYNQYNNVRTVMNQLQNNDLAFFSLCEKLDVSCYDFVLKKLTYCINLESRMDRLRRILAEVKPLLSQEFQIWKAIQHKEGWLGCIQSHAAVLSHSLATNLTNMHMILEDDCKLSPEFKDRFPRILEYLERHNGWDLFLGGGAYVKPKRLVCCDPILVECEWAVCMHFAIHTRKSAFTVIEYARNLATCRLALDTHVSSKHRGKIWLPYPFLATQHPGDTNIGTTSSYTEKIQLELQRSEQHVKEFVETELKKLNGCV
jgi:hypothetical protein